MGLPLAGPTGGGPGEQTDAITSSGWRCRIRGRSYGRRTRPAGAPWISVSRSWSIRVSPLASLLAVRSARSSGSGVGTAQAQSRIAEQVVDLEHRLAAALGLEVLERAEHHVAQAGAVGVAQMPVEALGEEIRLEMDREAGGRPHRDRPAR